MNSQTSNDQLTQEIEAIEQTEDITVDESQKKINPKKLKRQKRNRAFFIIWNLLSVIFYSVFVSFSIYKSWASSSISYIVLGGTIIYFIVFFILIICSSKNNKLMKNKISTYKTQMKLWRTILALLNLTITIVILIQTARIDNKDFLLNFVYISSIVFVAFRILFSLCSIFRLIRKQKRINKKRKKIIEKNNLKK